MYEVDERDRVIEIDVFPQSSIGAPLPCVLADEGKVVLAYYVEESYSEWEGSTPRIVTHSNVDELIAIVTFEYTAYFFGPPNDEAFLGHPLANRGLHSYSVSRVEHSSWIRKLERMNSVHPRHRPERFWQLQHLVFAFHDSIFECVCRSFEISRLRGSIRDALPQMMQLLELDRLI